MSIFNVTGNHVNMIKRKQAAHFRTDLRETLVELIEACTHHILATRSVYPKSIFKKQLFGPVHCGVPVMVCEHPDVNSFITEGLTGFKEALMNQITLSLISQFDLVINQNTHQGDEMILETYSFKFEFLSCNGTSRQNLLLKQEDYSDIEHNIRALLLCLTSRMTEMGKIKPIIKGDGALDLSFNFRLHTVQRGADALANNLKWCKIPSEKSQSVTSEDPTDTAVNKDESSEGFSICDMVKEKSERLLNSKNPIKGEKPKIKPDIKLDERIAHILQEPKEDDSVVQNIAQNNACEVILPVYQFNNPFKLNLSIEFSEDHK